MIEITGNDLSIEDIVQVARNDIEVRISSNSIKRVSMALASGKRASGCFAIASLTRDSRPAGI